MPQDEKDKDKSTDTPVSVLLDEMKKMRADIEALQKENKELKEFAVESTRRVFVQEPEKEESDDKLDEIVKYYKKGY